VNPEKGLSEDSTSDFPLSPTCHPERSSCFAEREAATESKDLLSVRAEMNREKEFSRSRPSW
jgi:hypothetical protein